MKKLLVWVPTYSWTLWIELIKFLDNIQLPEWWAVAKAYAVRTPIHQARNVLLEKMVEWDFDYIIMIDDDEYPEKPDCFKKMLEANEDMISWVVRLRIKQENLNILKEEISDEPWMEWMKKYINYTSCDNRGLFKIANAWAWLIGISRRVAELMLKTYKEPFESKETVYVKHIDWTRWEVGYSKKEIDMTLWKPQMCKRVLSEDYLFFERARNQWYELKCHWDCRAIHLGEPQKIIV